MVMLHIALPRLLLGYLPLDKAHWAQDSSKKRVAYYVRCRGFCQDVITLTLDAGYRTPDLIERLERARLSSRDEE